MNQDKPTHESWMEEEFTPQLVSVIVPTYNRAPVLVEALDSAWKQTYRPIELLIVDDGSTDGTEELLEKWRRTCDNDCRFSLRYFFQENAGAPSARNLGLIESKGEYIQFLDSDDVLYPDMLQQIVNVFERKHCDFVHVGYEKICAGCMRPFYQYIPEYTEDAVASYMSGKFFGNTSSLTRRRSLCIAVGPWNESLPIDQDGDYMCRTVLQTTNMGVVRDILFAYMVRPGTKITDRRGTRNDWQARLQREEQFCRGTAGREDYSPQNKGVYAGNLYGLAVRLLGGEFSDIGNAFGNLANGITGATLDRQGERMRWIWKRGSRSV